MQTAILWKKPKSNIERTVLESSEEGSDCVFPTPRPRKSERSEGRGGSERKAETSEAPAPRQARKTSESAGFRARRRRQGEGMEFAMRSGWAGGKKRKFLNSPKSPKQKRRSVGAERQKARPSEARTRRTAKNRRFEASRKPKRIVGKIKTSCLSTNIRKTELQLPNP